MKLIEEYKEQAFNGKSEETIKTYVRELKLFNNWLDGVGTDLSHFSRIDVQHYINWLTAKKMAASTINKKFRAISHYCKFTKQEEFIQDIRVVRPPNPNQVAPKALKRNEKNQMLREFARKGNKRDFAIIVLLLNTGIRVKECEKLLIRNLIDIGEKKGSLKVEGKGNKERIVPLNSDVRYALSEYLKERNINIYKLNSLSNEMLNEPLFKSNYNKAISKRTLQKIASEFEGSTAHILRHTFATELIRDHKNDPIAVAQLLGHSDLSTIQRYTRATEEELLSIVEKLTDQ